MTAYNRSLSDGLATDDTLGYDYVAIRSLTDTVGRAALGNATILLMFPTGGTADTSTRRGTLHRAISETSTGDIPGLPATPILDNFNRPAENPLSDNGMWIASTFQDGGFNLATTGTQLYSPSGGWGGNFWNVPFAPPVEVYVDMPVANTIGFDLFWTANSQSSANTGYSLVFDGAGGLTIQRVDPHTLGTVIANGSFTNSNNVSVAMRVLTDGSIQAWEKISGSWHLILSATDTTYLNQSGLLGIDAQGTTVRFDNFGGGTFVYGTPGTDSALAITNVSRTLIDSLTISDAPLRQDAEKRHITDSLTAAHDTTTLSFFGPVRHFTESIGLRSDVVTRVHGVKRLTLTESHTTSDSLVRKIGFLFVLPETHTTSDSLARKANWKRPITTTLITADVFGRITNRHIVLAERYPTTEGLHRFLASRRSFTVIQPTTDTWIIHPVKPRSIFETLTTSDAITSETLPGAIMGYIWVDNNGNVIANMPDWGWVLVEDPIHGNTMTAIPISTRTVDFSREK